LNNVTASLLTCIACIGNSQLGVNYADNSSQGGPATTALTASTATLAPTVTNATIASALEGVPATTYARLDIGNTFIGNQAVTGNISSKGSLTVGGGTPVVEYISITDKVTLLRREGSQSHLTETLEFNQTDCEFDVHGVTCPQATLNLN
jgi:hypothetical protein